VVFEAEKLPLVPVSPCFAPLDSLNSDDELIYPVPDSAPVLLNLNAKFNSRPFLFDGYVSKASATILVDSGASTSFVSRQWRLQHHINSKACQSYGRLADISSFSIPGKLSRAHLRLGGLRVKHDFLVAGLPGLDVVLALGFLEQYDPTLQSKKCYVEISDPRQNADNVYTISTTSREVMPHIDANCIELCTMREFANTCVNEDCNDGEVFVGFIRCSDADSPKGVDEHLYAG
jgi:Retroviral aspartyl protease